MNKDTLSIDATDKIFTASQVAGYLKVTTRTLKNREEAEIYPPPWRDPINNYRKYSVLDVMVLQLRSFKYTEAASFVDDLDSKLSKKYKGTTTQDRAQYIIEILDWCHGRIS